MSARHCPRCFGWHLGMRFSLLGLELPLLLLLPREAFIMSLALLQGQSFYMASPVTGPTHQNLSQIGAKRFRLRQANKFGFHLLSAVTTNRHTRLALHSPVLQLGILHFCLQLCCMFKFAMPALWEGFASPFARPIRKPFCRAYMQALLQGLAA